MIFIHIPKTGGTSIRKAMLASGCSLLEIYDDRPDKTMACAMSQLINDDTIVFGHFDYGVHERLVLSPVYATILRNPINRIHSWYRHQRRESGLPYYEAIHKHGATLADFLAFDVNNNHMTKILSGQSFVSADDRQALALAKQHLDDFAFIGIQERLEEDIPRLSRLLGTELDVEHLNVDPAPKEPDSYRARLMNDLIADHNLLDIELFEYVLTHHSEFPLRL